MPVAHIHVTEGQHDDERLVGISNAIQSALVDVISCPQDDFYQIIHELPKKRFPHTRSFLGLNYTDKFILLEITFLMGRSAQTRMSLLKVLNERVSEAAGISPDDLMTLLYEIPAENASFGQGVAQRVGIVPKP